MRSFLHCGTGHSASAQADNFTRCPALQADPGPDEEAHRNSLARSRAEFLSCSPSTLYTTQAPSQLQGGTVYVRDHQDMQFIRRAIDKKARGCYTINLGDLLVLQQLCCGQPAGIYLHRASFIRHGLRTTVAAFGSVFLRGLSNSHFHKHKQFTRSLLGTTSSKLEHWLYNGKDLDVGLELRQTGTIQASGL